MYGTATSMLRTSPQQNTYENNNKSLTLEVVYNFAPARFNATTANGKENKAGYTASLVACGWAGAVFELLKHLARSSEAKDRKNIKKIK